MTEARSFIKFIAMDKRIRRVLITSLLLTVLTGCGHQRVARIPPPPPLSLPPQYAIAAPAEMPQSLSAQQELQAVVAPNPSSRPDQSRMGAKKPEASQDCPVLIFTCPGVMEFDKTIDVSVIIAPKYSENLSSQLMKFSICKDESTCKELVSSVCQNGYKEFGNSKLWEINVSHWMTVALDASPSDFLVEHLPTYPEQDPIAGEFAVWDWQIKPKDGSASRQISFELYSRLAASDAHIPIRLRPNQMSKTITVTGLIKHDIEHNGAIVVEKVSDFTLDKIMETVIGGLISAFLVVFLKKKWPSVFAKQ